MLSEWFHFLAWSFFTFFLKLKVVSNGFLVPFLFDIGDIRNIAFSPNKTFYRPFQAICLLGKSATFGLQ
jgi:hypothetical protein